MKHSGLRTLHPRHSARGSVLLFAIVLLSMLAMLGTTFILFVRQSRMVSTNTVTNVETEVAAQSGLNHATQLLQLMVKNRPMVARKTVEYLDAGGNLITEYHSGVFSPLNADFIYLDSHYEAWTAGGGTQPPVDIAFWHFENNIAGGNGAVLSTASGTGNPLRYTTSLLAARPNTAGEIANRLEIQGYTNDLYKFPSVYNDPIRQSQRVSSVRGEYSVWMSDNDTKLYAVPRAWGMDTTNVPGALDTRTISRSILGSLKEMAALNDLDDADLETMCDFVPGANFQSFGDFAYQLTSVDTAYTPVRAEIEYYFRVLLDTPVTTANAPFPTVREHPAAININTAPIETLAAAISQIPDDANSPIAALSTDRAVAIAKRIIAKRPFLCRMDFEDFLAAHLMGHYTDPAFAPPDDALTMPDDTHIDEPEIPFVRRIYFALLRRWQPGHALTDPLFQAPELSLEGYMEIPGITTTNSPELAMNVGGTTVWPNHALYQKSRFEYFFREDASAPRATALLTPKEFNNFANSITTASYTDDVQQMSSNTFAFFDDELVIAPGPNGTLETAAQGDDYIISHIEPGPTHVITPAGDDEIDVDGYVVPGPNNILDTPADAAQGDRVVYEGIAVGPNLTADTILPRGRPSYYSFVDDATYADNFWINLPDSQDVTNTPEEFAAAKHLKFYYRLAKVDPPVTQREPATLKDLVSWSCYPDVGSERKPGLYQISFDGWGDASFYYGIGTMLAQGDPDEDPNQLYSTATRTSGAGGNGDVSWSPQIGFRSRFFNIYVLGRGKLQGWNSPETNSEDPLLRSRLMVTGERRLEAVYDGLKDQILWQRSPVSEKHSLAAP